MLHIGDLNSEVLVANKELHTVVETFREREIRHFTQLFDEAILRGEIRKVDSRKIVELFLDTLAGLNLCEMARQGKYLIPESQGFDAISSRQKELTKIFLNGLK
jgi:hypothetical protein